VRSVAWLFTTRMSIFTSGRRSILTLADFRGLRIRGINTLNETGLRAVAAAPAATPAPEVVGAPQSGVLDAGLTDVSAFVSRRFHKVQRFGTVRPFFGVFTQGLCQPALLGSARATGPGSARGRAAQGRGSGLTD
jgi:hypothetical protein